MMNIIPKTSRSIASIVLLVAFLSSLLNLPACPVKTAESSGPTVWVLTETLVNPTGEQLEFYGGGATPGWFVEERFKGMFIKYAVTETSFRIDDRYVKDGQEHYNVTFETYFEKPPLQLTPGETIELIAGFSHSGTGDGGKGVQFWYDSEGVDIQPHDTFKYSPWFEGFDGTSEATYTFDVPPAATGGEIEIYASWWNAPPCLVIWKYQAQEAQPDVDEVGATEESGEQQDEAEGADVISTADNGQDVAHVPLFGEVIALIGEVTIISRNGQRQSLKKGDLVPIGSIVSTGARGRVRIRVNDLQVDGEWLDLSEPGSDARLRESYEAGSRIGGPTFINLGNNSEMNFETLEIDFGDPPRSSSLVEILKGTIRTVFQGWKTGDSDYSVKAGVSICGIRGSDVYILHNPEIDFVNIMVIEGHADVTSEATGETVSLSDYQEVLISKGDIVASGDFDQEQWDAAMEESRLGDEDFPDADFEWPSDLEEPTVDADEPGFKREEPASGLLESLPVTESVAVLCGMLLCGGVIIAIIAVVIFLVRRRSKRKPEDDAR